MDMAFTTPLVIRMFSIFIPYSSVSGFFLRRIFNNNHILVKRHRENEKNYLIGIYSPSHFYSHFLYDDTWRMTIDFAIESSLRLWWRNPPSWAYQLSRFTKLFSSVFIVLSLFPLEVIRRSRVEYFTLNWLGGYKRMDRYRATWWFLFATYTFPYRQDAALENSRRKEAFCSGIFIIRLMSSPPKPPQKLCNVLTSIIPDLSRFPFDTWNWK